MNNCSCSGLPPSPVAPSGLRGSVPPAFPVDEMLASLAGRFAPMDAMVRTSAGSSLVPAVLPVPEPTFGEVLLEVRASTVCNTEHGVADGGGRRLLYPVVPGHEVVGIVVATGDGVDLPVGTRVGVSCLAWACGRCERCRSGRENLCDRAELTGHHRHGGFAQLAIADARYCLPLSARYDDAQAAALLCAGLLGYQALRAAGPVGELGLLGLGPAARLTRQLAENEGRRVLVLPGPRDGQTQGGRVRDADVSPAGGRGRAGLDALILFPDSVGVPPQLRAVRSGGVVVCAGITPGAALVAETSSRGISLRLVGSATRAQAMELLALAELKPLRIDVTTRSLAAANDAERALRAGSVSGSLVLIP